MTSAQAAPTTTVSDWSPYKVGLAYVDELVSAVRYADAGDLATATEHAVKADVLLFPLGDSLDGEDYRAFIAGAAAAADHYLRLLSVPLPWDG